jgi:hypothetical protein
MNVSLQEILIIAATIGMVAWAIKNEIDNHNDYTGGLS